MAKGLGNNYFLWIESATPGTYNIVKGQQNLSITRGADKIDTTTKDSGGYKTAAMGLKDLSVKLDLMPDLPDATGYTRLETQCLATPPVPFNVQIRKGGTAGASGDVVFAASMYGDLTSQNFDQSTANKASFNFTLAAAPTTDVMAV